MVSTSRKDSAPVDGRGTEPAVSSSPRGRGLLLDAWETVLAYVALTKPRVIELLLVAAIPAMLQADRGEVHAKIIILTLIGGFLGAGSANSLNMVVDADIDKVMKRTERRPLARRTVTPRAALVFGLTLGVVSFFWLWRLANSLTAGIFILITIAFYVLVYSMILKRRTAQNVVWGGAAGCMPVLIGWAAVKDNMDVPMGDALHWWQPVVLFLVIFFWTPPHTWALAMRYKDDYERAGVPMLPVIMEAPRVTLRIVIYTWATVLCTIALIPAAGWIYAAAALGAGVWFLAMAHRLHGDVSKGAEVKPLRLFILSNNYLAIVCVGLSVDAVLNMTTLGSLIG